jgi:transposase-like protein
MRRKRRNHPPEFKAKVALTAIQGELTIAELVTKFDVHANQISDWKKQLLGNASDVFSKGTLKGVAPFQRLLVCMLYETPDRVGQ